jgi:hypothetical protein
MPPKPDKARGDDADSLRAGGSVSGWELPDQADGLREFHSKLDNLRQ